MAGRRIGTGQVLIHDFGKAGASDVTLIVTDDNGISDEQRARVAVTAGRVPMVSSLTCIPRR